MAEDDVLSPSLPSQGGPIDRELLLLDWGISIPPIEAQTAEADKGAVGFSQLGIKSAFILNGGALVALPALVPFLGIKTDCSLQHLKFAAALFVLGIIFALVATIVSYLLMCSLGEYHRLQRASVGQEILNKYCRGDGNVTKRTLIKGYADSWKEQKHKNVRRLKSAMLVCVITTSVCFLVAATLLLYVAWG